MVENATMKKLLFFFLLLCVSGGELFAQNSTASPIRNNPQSPDDQNRIKVRVELVNVLTTVTDKKNRLVTDLTKDDFRIFEDGKPQDIRFFSRETDLPLRIGILIDASNSIRGRLHFEQEAAIDFLNAAVRPGKDLAFVVAFDVQPQLLQDYSDDIDKLSNAIQGIRAGGVTSLFDAVFFSCKEKLLFFPPPEPYLRRVIIIFSDGEDNQSVHGREEALAMAQRAEVTIYTISTNWTGTEGRGDKVLRRLADETGGHAFFPFAASDLAANFEEIARELRSQYSLAYVSTNPAHDGTFRNITIQPVDKNLRVRAKPGYFALSP
jgi:VWFA-related protein